MMIFIKFKYYQTSVRYICLRLVILEYKITSFSDTTYNIQTASYCHFENLYDKCQYIASFIILLTCI